MRTPFLASLALSMLIAGCGSASDGAENKGPAEPPRETVTVAQVEQLGFVMIDAPISGLTDPTHGQDGSTGEGTPIVSEVYFGVSNTPMSESDRRYACTVPEHFRLDVDTVEAKQDMPTWKCVKLNV